MTTPTVHLLLACRQGEGAAQARKWGWEPAVLRVWSRPTFIDPDGDLVMVTSSAADLRGLDPGVKVYLGPAWVFAHGDPRDGLRAHVSKGGRLLIEEWKGGEFKGFVPPPYAI